MYKTVSYKQKLDQIKVYITLIRYEKSLKKKKKKKEIDFIRPRKKAAKLFFLSVQKIVKSLIDILTFSFDTLLQ